MAGFCSPVLADGNPAAGQQKFSTCAGCHGIPGYTNVYPTYHVPRLGGQRAEYIVSALKSYRAGDRQHPTMHANSWNLSDQDMADIAAYVASYTADHPPQRVRGDVQAGAKKSATCIACHGPDGHEVVREIQPPVPRLAGQYEDYLRKSLQEYHSGVRKNAVMNGIAAPLSAQDMADLAAYYASLGKGLVVIKK